MLTNHNKPKPQNSFRHFPKEKSLKASKTDSLLARTIITIIIIRTVAHREGGGEVGIETAADNNNRPQPKIQQNLLQIKVSQSTHIHT